MKKYLILCAAALTLGITGCKKDFLDEKPSDQLSAEQIKAAAEKDPSLLTGYMAGIYSTMYVTGSGGTTGHDDFGQKGFDIYGDMLASDMVLGALNYNWYSTVARYQASENYTLNPTYIPWRYYYRIILSANGVMETLGGEDADVTVASDRHIMGQAKAMRAYAYFYLSQFYSPGYGTGSEKTLPIYRNTQMQNQPKSTSAEVYDLIISDLTEAIDYLSDFNRTTKDQVNQSVAKGLLSYALAARGTNEDLQKVITLTDEVITTGGFRMVNENEVVAKFDATGALINPAAGFNNVTNPSWMWGVDLTTSNELDLISWWGQVDLYTYSYAWAGDPKYIDAGLYASIREGDLRKSQFVDVDENGQFWPTNKFFAPARRIGGQRVIETDYVYMRLEEMVLLNAEAKAKLGLDGPARAMLASLLDLRMEDFSYVNTLSGKALQDEIYLQTRIELWGEGKSYLALKRNKETLTRGENHLFFPGESFSYDSPQLTFPIPQAEVLNNPNLGQ